MDFDEVRVLPVYRHMFGVSIVLGDVCCRRYYSSQILSSLSPCVILRQEQKGETSTIPSTRRDVSNPIQRYTECNCNGSGKDMF